MAFIKMNLLFLCLFTTVWSVKERVSDQNLEQITNQLFHEIEKRLQAFDSQSSEHPDGEEDMKSINAITSNDTIIKTKESIAAGAIFLDAPDAKSGSQCLKKCFGNEDCNLAVFKEKMGDTSCYMFDCGSPSVCQFIEHENFITIKLPDRKTSKISGVHEDDLERLAAPPTTTPQPTTETATTTTTTTTTTALNPTTLQVHRQVALYGQCIEDTECSDSHAECEAGYCVCKRGFTYQDDVCRADCTKFQFKCANEGQPLVYPQCIAIYDKCDDLINCKDGSDEENCDTNKEPAVDTSNEANSNQKHDEGMPGYGRNNDKPLPSEQEKPHGVETPTDKDDPSQINAVDKTKPDIKLDESAEEPIVMPTKQDKEEEKEPVQSSESRQDSSSEIVDDNGTNVNVDSDQTNVNVEDSKEGDNSQETGEDDDSAENQTNEKDIEETDDHNTPKKKKVPTATLR